LEGDRSKTYFAYACFACGNAKARFYKSASTLWGAGAMQSVALFFWG
jgi:hypothetical protein